MFSAVDVVGNAANLMRSISMLSESSVVLPSDQLSPHSPPTSINTSQDCLRATWDTVLDDLQSNQGDNNSSYAASNESLASSGIEGPPGIYEEGVRSAVIAVMEMDKMTDASVEGLAADQEETMNMMEDECGAADPSEMGAGEALSGTVEELAPEALTPIKRKDSIQGKPPNILIYCGKKDSQRQYESVKATIQQCVNPDKYVIYQLKHEQVFSSPWADNTLLLIIASERVYDGIDQAFLQYFLKGGRVASFGSFFDGLLLRRVAASSSIASIMSLTYKQWKDVVVISTKFRYQDTHCLLPGVTTTRLAMDPAPGGLPVMVEAAHDLTGGVAVLSQVCSIQFVVLWQYTFKKYVA